MCYASEAQTVGRWPAWWRPECFFSSSILCEIEIFAADSGRGSKLLAVGTKTTANKSDPLWSHSCNKNNKAVVAGPCILYAKFSKHQRCCGFIKWKQSWRVATAAVSVSCCSAKRIFTFDSQFCHFAVQSYYANAGYAWLWGWLAVFRLQGILATSSKVAFLSLLIVPCVSVSSCSYCWPWR